MPNLDPVLHTTTAQSRYLKIIDKARKVTAITTIICGLGFIVCLSPYDYFTQTLRRDAGIWSWGIWISGIGIAICFIATLIFIVEYLARPVAPNPIKFRSLLARGAFIITVTTAICYLMSISFGAGHGFGAGIGTIILFSSLRQEKEIRIILATAAAIILGITLLSTQTTYQYARRHANEIVNKGCELIDQCPKNQLGHEIELNNPLVPKIFQTMGTRSIFIDKDHIAIFVPGFFKDREFIIYYDNNYTVLVPSIWIKRRTNKDTFCTISDQLLMTDY